MKNVKVIPKRTFDTHGHDIDFMGDSEFFSSITKKKSFYNLSMKSQSPGSAGSNADQGGPGNQ